MHVPLPFISGGRSCVPSASSNAPFKHSSGLPTAQNCCRDTCFEGTLPPKVIPASFHLDASGVCSNYHASPTLRTSNAANWRSRVTSAPSSASRAFASTSRRVVSSYLASNANNLSSYYFNRSATLGYEGVPAGMLPTDGLLEPGPARPAREP